MRPNTALRDLVDKLLQARPAYIAALRSHKSGYSRLVKASTTDTPQGTSSSKRQLRSSRTASAPVPVSPSLEDAADLQVSESPRKRQRLSGNSAASSSVPASAKSKTVAPSSADVAACPICNRTFKAGRVLEAHVNRCIDNPPPAEDTPVPEQPKQHAQKPLQRKAQKGLPQVKVPAKIAFHLFNDKKLRDKLKDVNLPVTGKRKVCCLCCNTSSQVRLHCTIPIASLTSDHSIWLFVQEQTRVFAMHANTNQENRTTTAAVALVSVTWC